MQELAYSGAQLLAQDLHEAADKELRARIATAAGNLMRNWAVLAESMRVLKGDPMPGSLRPEPKRKAKRGPLITLADVNGKP